MNSWLPALKDPSKAPREELSSNRSPIKSRMSWSMTHLLTFVPKSHSAFGFKKGFLMLTPALRGEPVGDDKAP